ncbi:protocatechuate 3,4-dioxygenase subunit alpha [Deinococcus aquiradiocola]|uniref:Protocatechuate 3,4-dioxygenase subunit alpha n=1 Tax=Deinococcus aquiradiocola TaxID=393059 RepID=A0A917PAC1_9DEIO|nr:protocatechuate 3,4-dioxygenase subunit alpha [Deinococcus aquiradiocola]GGJ68523.1 protocatechuate 3,4-dioxygenase subunit alpha [Deinococcus aquiradiocola]
MTTEPPPLPEDTSNLAGNFGPSPSQTVGPYFHQGLVPGVQGLQAGLGHVMVTPGSPVPGERVTLTGRVLDGDGVTIEDALIEVWQADANGAYPARADADFGGYGRAHTRTPLHRYALHTLKPGSAAPGLAPRLNVWLGMRGLLTHLVTAVYFSDEDNSGDPLLNAVPDHRRHTLIARREDTPDGAVYHLDFRMQGQDETVFFDAY